LKKKKQNILSQCCKSSVDMDISPDFFGDDPKTMKVGTSCFICTKCKKPCDIIIDLKK